MSAVPRLPWPALALLGAALTLLAALITVSAPGAGPPPGPGAVVALADGDAIAWTFTAERGGLSGMRVWLARPAPAGAALALTIADAELPGLPLVRAAAPLRAAGPDGAVNLAFAPLRVAASPQVPTATLLVRLTAEGPAAAVALLGDGEGGVAFAPRYRVRPFDAILPISAMAAGRPGLLGWPPLYALLVYAFLVALLRALARGWRLGASAGAPSPH